MRPPEKQLLQRASPALLGWDAGCVAHYRESLGIRFALGRFRLFKAWAHS